MARPIPSSIRRITQFRCSRGGRHAQHAQRLCLQLRHAPGDRHDQRVRVDLQRRHADPRHGKRARHSYRQQHHQNGGNFNVLLNGRGTAGTDYDQLDATGDVTLGGNLNVILGVGYTPAFGDSFIIVNNEGADPISGTFAGLPEGGLLAVGGDVFQISYTGGDGNDVVLTCVKADIWTAQVSQATTGATAPTGSAASPRTPATTCFSPPGQRKRRTSTTSPQRTRPLARSKSRATTTA